MNSTTSGRDAEERVAEELKKSGHKIIAMNWRTRWCEIDIVSTYQKTVYFTEVKFRSSDAWGTGFDYITKQKLKQMHFAAEFWLSENNWRGEAVLQVAEVDNQKNIDIISLDN